VIGARCMSTTTVLAKAMTYHVTHPLSIDVFGPCYLPLTISLAPSLFSLLLMAEKSDAATRLRRAVKGQSASSGPFLTLIGSIPSVAENNLFLVKRLIRRTDMRNPDPSQKRYTSLAWAAVLGHEETFEFLLSSGHDDEELSKVRLVTVPFLISSLDVSFDFRTQKTTLF
jgi:hypothetical protein